MTVAVRGVGNLPVYQMRQTAGYTLLLMSMSESIAVYTAESVMASLNSELVSVGNSVQFTTGINEV